MTKNNFQEYLCVDPSFFAGVNRLETLPKVLDSLKQPDSKIVLASELRSLFSSQNDFNEKISPDSNFVKLLKKWNSNFDSKVESELSSLQEMAQEFYSNYRPIFADDIIVDLEKIGPQSIHLSDVVGKLGNLVGKTIFELMAVSYEKHGIILSYGRKPISLIRKITSPALEGYSQMKHRMIVSGRAPKTLKIIGVFFDAMAANDFVDQFEIAEMPVPLQEIGELGLALIADG